jgi:hypothetical protein
LHRYHPDLHPTRRLPAFRVVRSHRRPRSGWPPWAAASVMIALGVTAVLWTLAASRGPAVHHHLVRLPGIVQPAAPESVASDPPVDQGDQGQGQGQQRGDDPASRSTPRPVPTSTGIADPPLAPAAGNPPDPTPNPLLLPVPTSPPPMVVPSPSSTPGPGCGRKPPHPTRSPKITAEQR